LFWLPEKFTDQEEEDDMTGQATVKVELKYCEQCGGLLLRRAGDAVVFCSPCARRAAELPVARKRAPQTEQGRHSSGIAFGNGSAKVEPNGMQTGRVA
jgi:hypothetical protein